MLQTNLFNNNVSVKPTKNNHSQTDKIWENIKEWNTIEGIELYEPLYNLYSQLFMLTFNNKLKCLNYYIEEDNIKGKIITLMYAEIKETWNLSLKERYQLHQDLIDRIKNNDTTLEYEDKSIEGDNPTLFSFL